MCSWQIHHINNWDWPESSLKPIISFTKVTISMFSVILVLPSWWVEVSMGLYIYYYYTLVVLVVTFPFSQDLSGFWLCHLSLFSYLCLCFSISISSCFLLFVNLVIMLLSTLSVIINKDPVKTDLRQERKCTGSHDQKVQRRFRYTWLQVNKQLPSEGSSSAYLWALFSSVWAWTSDPVILEKDLDLSFIALCLK